MPVGIVRRHPPQTTYHPLPVLTIFHSRPHRRWHLHRQRHRHLRHRRRGERRICFLPILQRHRHARRHRRHAQRVRHLQPARRRHQRRASGLGVLRRRHRVHVPELDRGHDDLAVELGLGGPVGDESAVAGDRGGVEVWVRLLRLSLRVRVHIGLIRRSMFTSCALHGTTPMASKWPDDKI